MNSASQSGRPVQPRIPLTYLYLAVKTEWNFERLTEIASRCREAGKELLLSCSRGSFYGLGVGLFMFLRLGAPATQELCGYMVGLFLVAGLKFGLSLWVIRSLVFPLIRHIRHSNSPT
jgi:hypothetical protein